MKSLLKLKFELLLSCIIVGYIVLFSYLSIYRTLSLNSHYYDLGIMNQTVYNTSRGHFLEMTNQDFKKNISRLAVHFDPILALFAPFYLIFSGPDGLLISQTFIVGLGAVAVYMIAHHLLTHKWYALIFAVSYLLYFPVERANLFDFHAVVLATTFLLLALYFGLVRRHALSFLFIVLALLTKENVGMVTFLYGMYLFFARKERKWGIFIGLISIIFFVSAFFIIIPYFREQQNHFALQYFGDFGDSPKKIALTIFLNPSTTLKHLFTSSNGWYLLELLFAHVLFIIFSPLTFLIALPEITLNLLSSNANMKSIYFHYNAVIIPFIMLSSISGFAAIINIYKNRQIQYIAMGIFITLSLFQIYLFSPLPLSFLKKPFIFYPVNHSKLNTLQNWQSILKNDTIKVSTTPRLAPFFTSRRYYYNFLFDPGYLGMGKVESDILSRIDNYSNADFIIIDLTELENPGSKKLLQRFYSHLKGNPSFKMIAKDGDIEVYKKQI